jgi:small-conductance mechanosensitive channel/CRP-like cAMP-binding protein
MKTVQRLLFPSFAISAFALLALSVERILSFFQVESSSLTGQVLYYLTQTGLWISGAFLLNRSIDVLFWQGLVGRAFQGTIPKLLKDVIAFIIYALAVAGIIGIAFGKSVTGIWATSSVLGIVLGLALRSIILDMFTGLAINLENPYSIGDWIRLQGRTPEQDVVGKVSEITWRTTRMVTEENNLIVMPNSMMGISLLVNYSNPEMGSRFEFPIIIDFSIPVQRARRVLLAGARAVMNSKGFVPEPQPQILVNAAHEMGIEYKVRYWITPWHGVSPSSARSVVLSSILDHLQKAGITPAYPKEDVYMARLPARHMDGTDLDNRLELLARTELFEQIARSDLQRLARSIKHRIFHEGDRLITQGDAGDSMFILLEGLLDVCLQKETGTESPIAQMQPHDFFGEMSLLTGAPRSATVVAATDVVVFEITKEDIEKLLLERPLIAEILSNAVAVRNLRSSESYKKASDEEKATQTQGLAQQISNRIRKFFKGVCSPSVF